jgi:uncharacterized protein YlxW (UPF0749 family)
MADGTDVQEAGSGTPSPDMPIGTPLDWKAPGDEPVARQSGYAARDRSSGWRVAAIIGLLIAGLLVAAIVVLWQKVDDLSSDNSQTRSRVTDASGVVASVDGLQQSVDGLQASVKALTDSTTAANAANADTQAKLTALQTRVDTLTACVNTYQSAISQWTRNPGSSVQYTPC